MNAFAQHFAFEFKTGLRNPMHFFMLYLFPLGFYALMSFVMTQINPGFTEVMIPAMVIFTITAGTILGLPNPLVESREAGIYRSYKINGVPAPSILSIPMITAIFHVLIASIVVVVTATPFFNAVAPLNWGAFTLVILITAFACGAIGALIGVISANAQGTVLWSQLIFLPSMLIGGLMMPLSLLPKAMLPFSALLPTAHAMQALEGLAYDRATAFNPTVSLIALLAGGLLAFGLAIYLFNWDSKNQSRRGHPLMALLALAPFVVSIFFQ